VGKQKREWQAVGTDSQRVDFKGVKENSSLEKAIDSIQFILSFPEAKSGSSPTRCASLQGSAKKKEKKTKLLR